MSQNVELPIYNILYITIVIVISMFQTHGVFGQTISPIDPLVILWRFIYRIS